MLEKTVLSVPFSSGIDEKYQSQLLPQGYQAAVINGVYTKNGSIRKRYGTVALGTNPALVGCNRLGTRQGELYAGCDDGAGNTGLFRYQPDVTGVEWGLVNPTAVSPQLPPCLATRAGTIGSYAILAQDMVITGNFATYACEVFQASGGGGTTGTDPFTNIIVFTVDLTTNVQTQLQTFTLANTDLLQPKLFLCGTKIVLLYCEAVGNIYASTSISTGAMTGGTFSVPTAIATDFEGNTTAFDGRQIDGTTDFVIAYQQLVTGDLIVTSFTNALVLVATSTTTTSSASGFFGMAVQGTAGENVWVAYSDTNAGVTAAEVTTLRLDPATLVVSFALTTLTFTQLIGYADGARIGLQRQNATDVTVIASVAPLTGTNAGVVMWQTIRSNGTRPGSAGVQYMAHLMSRPFQYNSHTYIAAFYLGGPSDGAVSMDPSTTTQPTTYLLDLGADPSLGLQAQCVATLAPGISTDILNYIQPNEATICQSPTDVSQWLMPLAINAGASGRTSLQTATFDFGRPDRWLNQEFANTAYIMGGVPTCYDGSTLTEAGYLYYPEGVGVVAGSGGTLGGVYQYVVVFESYDQNGNIRRSSPSNPTSVTLSSQEAVITYPNYTFSNNASNAQQVSIAIYRTQGNQSVFYQVTSINPSLFFASNVQNVSHGTYTDNLSDANLANDPILPYVNSAELPANCVPSENFSCVHLGRLVCCGGDDPHNVFYTKPFTVGIAPEFNDNFVIVFDEPIVACASIEGQLVAWSAKSIYVVIGNGPDNTGGGDGFSTPQRVTSDVGCIEPRSLVILQDGIMFLSAAGLYMLTRSLEVVYQGHNVEDEINNPDFRDVTSAILLDTEAQQRFSVRYNDNPGKTLVYDDVQKSWSTFQYTNGDANEDNVSAVRWIPPGSTQPSYVFTDGNTVYQEDESLFTDVGHWVTRTVTSAWIRSQNVQGFVRIWNVMAIGEVVTPNNMTLSYAFNYETSTSQTHTWPWSSLTTFNDTTRQQISMKPYQQKVQAIQVTITDAQPDTGGIGTGEGATLLSLDFEFGIKKGYWKGLPAAGRY